MSGSVQDALQMEKTSAFYIPDLQCLLHRLDYPRDLVRIVLLDLISSKCFSKTRQPVSPGLSGVAIIDLRPIS